MPYVPVAFVRSIVKTHFGPVAQGIEQWFPKPCAACSNHAGATLLLIFLLLDCARLNL
jgi:hypothetical protein